ncbi:MAG TPA: LON peptidase substrate-binding domain-containing protein, partial [Levilinea sp.]|nr:LON peptidase substrate-binding domain-containing protein [Levilinea sp.]
MKIHPLFHYLSLSPSATMIIMIYELPLFPLNTVLFPGVPIQLHIFEGRYKLLVRYCLEKNEPFGVALIRKGMEALAALAEPYPIGCTARIVEIEPLDSGNMNLTALGDERFEIKALDRSMPYLIAKVEAKPLVSERALEQLPGTKLLEGWMKDYLSLL